MRKTLMTVVCAVFVLCSVCSLSAAEPVLRVMGFSGNVKLCPSPGADVVQCQEGMVLDEGATITAGEDEYVDIAVDKDGRNIVRVKENSEVMLRMTGDERVELIHGKVFLLLRDLKSGEKFRVRTPTAVCGARGTGWIMEASEDVTIVSVFDGIVRVHGRSADGSMMPEEHLVSEGHIIEIKKNEQPSKAEKMSELDIMRVEGELLYGETEGVYIQVHNKLADWIEEATRRAELRLRKLEKIRDISEIRDHTIPPMPGGARGREDDDRDDR